MSKNPMTATQLGHVAKLCEQHSIDKDRADTLFQTGLLSDLLAVENHTRIDRQAFRTFLAKVTRPKQRRSRRLVDSALLEPITIVSLPGAEAFSVKEKFAIGMQDGVEIGWHGGDFKEYFLGKNEIDVPAQQPRVHKLRRMSKDAPIIAELGGEELVAINLATMFELMKKQGTGQTGDLLVNGYANIFYIKDDTGTFWAVDCVWSSDDGFWLVGAYPITRRSGWDADSQVFSR